MPGLLSGLVRAGTAARIGANQGGFQADQLNRQRDAEVQAAQMQALKMALTQRQVDDTESYHQGMLGATNAARDETARHNKAMESRPIAGQQGHYTVTSGLGADGRPVIVRVNTRTGEVTPTDVGKPQTASGGLGMASIAKKLASNQQAVATVDDALSELTKYPDAVGLKRAGPDAWNQRVDPRGVPARASLANIASLVIHDRSGAAVTVSEAKRLTPFIPSVSDSPDVARQKLAKLRALILVETNALQSGPGQAHGMAPSTTGQSLPNGGGKTITVNGKTFVVPE